MTAPTPVRVAGHGGSPSVRRRLTLFTLSMSALMIVITAVSLTGVYVQREQADLLTLALGPTLDSNQAVHQTMTSAQGSLRGYLVLNRSGRSGNVEILRPYAEAEAGIQGQLTVLDNNLAMSDFSGSSIDRSRLLAQEGAQREAIEEWWAYARSARVATIITADELERGEAIFRRFVKENSALSDAIRSQRNEVRVALREGGVRSGQAVLLAAGVALVLALLAGWRTTVSLTVPLRKLRNVVHRQRHGDRSSWARTDIGASEVRELAADVNALTAVQIYLLDEQAYSLALQRAAAEIDRRMQDTADLAGAFTVVAQGLGRALRLDRSAVGVTGHNSRVDDVVVWTPSGFVGNEEVPITVPLDVGRLAERLWHGKRKLVVTDVTADPAMADLGWAPATLAMQPVGGLMLVAFGLTEQSIGAITLRTMTAPREWQDVEISFVEQVGSLLARTLAKAQTERDRREYIRQLEELDEHKDNFLSTVSHELRTPLTSIVGYLEMLNDGDAGDLTDMQRKMLDIIGRNAIRLRGLIEDLLVLNRLETTTLGSGAVDVVNIGDLVRLTSEELLPAATAGGVELLADGITLPAQVKGDRGQLSRALTNVVANAIKFTPEGGQVRLTCHLDGPDDTVEITCVDTGIGIPAADLGKLFTRFFRASNVTAAQIPGTGLGLAIVRSIVERHAGQLGLESVEGSGTTVRIVLPLSDPASNAGAA